jgi:hypothetical protein
MTRQTGEWSCGDLTPEDLPAGKYLAAYRTWEKRSYWHQQKIRLDFVIIEPVMYAGVIVSLFCTCTLSPNKRHSRASRFYKLWMQANGGQQPKAGQRMTPSIFDGYWHVAVVWGKDTKTGEPSIPKIEALLERVAGGQA